MPPKRPRKTPAKATWPRKAHKRDTTPVITDDEAWTSGNFEIITTDKVRFRVPDHLLFSVRKVFADAHSIAVGEKKVELVGSDETAAVLGMFLKFISTGSIKVDFALTGILELALFCQKWDCSARLAHLLRAVHSRVLLGKASSIKTFVLAAAVDDVETAKIALSNQIWTWTESDYKITNGVPKRRCLDPRAWGVATWRSIRDADYLFALSRAYEVARCKLSLPDEFVKYLEAARKV